MSEFSGQTGGDEMGKGSDKQAEATDQQAGQRSADQASEQGSDEKPEWDESTHGPVPEDSKDGYTVVNPIEGDESAGEQAQ
jgi:hypothetical protein